MGHHRAFCCGVLHGDAPAASPSPDDTARDVVAMAWVRELDVEPGQSFLVDINAGIFEPIGPARAARRGRA